MPTTVKKLDTADSKAVEQFVIGIRALENEVSAYANLLARTAEGGKPAWDQQQAKLASLTKALATLQNDRVNMLRGYAKKYRFTLRSDMYAAPHKDGGYAVFYEPL